MKLYISGKIYFGKQETHKTFSCKEFVFFRIKQEQIYQVRIMRIIASIFEVAIKAAIYCNGCLVSNGYCFEARGSIYHRWQNGKLKVVKCIIFQQVHER